ncbi:hypothetical protein [Shouchella shacheensis]|uniref:hypothetical protein n=1 Tax=Shouchella shacheensis TaxID=1649580 RepID=UPI00074006CE|nr:hypothetical protein [Shouchella shacheensis]
MHRYGPQTIIHHLRINNVSSGASINYGPSIHKGLQANMKIVAGEIAIGDEFSFACPEEEEEEEEA